MKFKSFHDHLDMKSFLLNKKFPEDYEQVMEFKEQKGFVTPLMVQTIFENLLKQGQRFLDPGDCDDFDPKYGCMGHKEEEELKPCPFCGSESMEMGEVIAQYDSGSYYIYCQECGARGPGFTGKGKEGQAINKWNWRRIDGARKR